MKIRILLLFLFFQIVNLNAQDYELYKPHYKAVGFDSFTFDPVISADERFIITGTNYGSAQLWERNSGKLIREFEASHVFPYTTKDYFYQIQYISTVSPEEYFLIKINIDSFERVDSVQIAHRDYDFLRRRKPINPDVSLTKNRFFLKQFPYLIAVDLNDFNKRDTLKIDEDRYRDFTFSTDEDGSQVSINRRFKNPEGLYKEFTDSKVLLYEITSNFKFIGSVDHKASVNNHKLSRNGEKLIVQKGPVKYHNPNKKFVERESYQRIGRKSKPSFREEELKFLSSDSLRHVDFGIENKVSIWQTRNLKQLFEKDLHAKHYNFSFSSDTVYFVSEGGGIMSMSLNGNRFSDLQALEVANLKMKEQDKLKYKLVAGEKDVLKVYDPETGKLIRNIMLHEDIAEIGLLSDRDGLYFKTDHFPNMFVTGRDTEKMYYLYDADSIVGEINHEELTDRYFPLVNYKWDYADTGFKKVKSNYRFFHGDYMIEVKKNAFDLFSLKNQFDFPINNNFGGDIFYVSKPSQHNLLTILNRNDDENEMLYSYNLEAGLINTELEIENDFYEPAETVILNKGVLVSSLKNENTAVIIDTENNEFKTENVPEYDDYSRKITKLSGGNLLFYNRLFDGATLEFGSQEIETIKNLSPDGKYGLEESTQLDTLYNQQLEIITTTDEKFYTQGFNEASSDNFQLFSLSKDKRYAVAIDQNETLIAVDLKKDKKLFSVDSSSHNLNKFFSLKHLSSWYLNLKVSSNSALLYNRNKLIGLNMKDGSIISNTTEFDRIVGAHFMDKNEVLVVGLNNKIDSLSDYDNKAYSSLEFRLYKGRNLKMIKKIAINDVFYRGDFKYEKKENYLSVLTDNSFRVLDLKQSEIIFYTSYDNCYDNKTYRNSNDPIKYPVQPIIDVKSERIYLVDCNTGDKGLVDYDFANQSIVAYDLKTNEKIFKSDKIAFKNGKIIHLELDEKKNTIDVILLTFSYLNFKEKGKVITINTDNGKILNDLNYYSDFSTKYSEIKSFSTLKNYLKKKNFQRNFMSIITYPFPIDIDTDLKKEIGEEFAGTILWDRKTSEILDFVKIAPNEEIVDYFILEESGLLVLKAVSGSLATDISGSGNDDWGDDDGWGTSDSWGGGWSDDSGDWGDEEENEEDSYTKIYVIELSDFTLKMKIEDLSRNTEILFEDGIDKLLIEDKDEDKLMVFDLATSEKINLLENISLVDFDFSPNGEKLVLSYNELFPKESRFFRLEYPKYEFDKYKLSFIDLPTLSEKVLIEKNEFPFINSSELLLYAENEAILKKFISDNNNTLFDLDSKSAKANDYEDEDFLIKVGDKYLAKSNNHDFPDIRPSTFYFLDSDFNLIRSNYFKTKNKVKKTDYINDVHSQNMILINDSKSGKNIGKTGRFNEIRAADMSSSSYNSSFLKYQYRQVYFKNQDIVYIRKTNGEIEFWDWQTNDLLFSYKNPNYYRFKYLENKGLFIVQNTKTSQYEIWDVKKNKVINRIDFESDGKFQFHIDEKLGLMITIEILGEFYKVDNYLGSQEEDDKFIFNSFTIRIYSLEDFEMISEIKEEQSFQDEPIEISFSYDSPHLQGKYTLNTDYSKNGSDIKDRRNGIDDDGWGLDEEEDNEVTENSNENNNSSDTQKYVFKTAYKNEHHWFLHSEDTTMLWDMKIGEKLDELNDSEEQLSDKEDLKIRTDNKKIEILDSKSETVLLTILLYKNGYLAFNVAREFDGSEEILKEVGLIKGTEFIQSDKLVNKYRKPGLVRSVIDN